MQSILVDNKKKIHDLCDRYKVEKLYAFGSVTRDDFNLESSDIDFLVIFKTEGLLNYADYFFGLQHSLQDLLKRPVELVVESAITNPYFKERVDQNKILIYGSII